MTWRFTLWFGLPLAVLFTTAYVSPLLAVTVATPLGSVARFEDVELGIGDEAEDGTSLRLDDGIRMDNDWSTALDETSKELDAGGAGNGEIMPAVL